MKGSMWKVILLGITGLWLAGCSRGSEPVAEDRVRLKTVTDRSDVTFFQVYSYDTGNRVVLVQSYFTPGGPFPPFSLDQANRMTYQYDAQGRLTQTDYLDYQSKQKAGESRIRYTYDGTGKIVTATYVSMGVDGTFTDTQQLVYELDAQNRPVKKTEYKLPVAGQTGLVTTYAYTDGNLTTIDAPLYGTDRVETGRLRTTYAYGTGRSPYYGLPPATIWGDQLAFRYSQNNVLLQTVRNFDKAGVPVTAAVTKNYSVTARADGRITQWSEGPAGSTYGLFYDYETY